MTDKEWYESTIKFKYIQFSGMQDIKLLDSFLSDTDYLVMFEEDKLCLITSRGCNEFSKIYEGDYIIKTKLNNVYVIDKYTFNNMEVTNNKSSVE